MNDAQHDGLGMFFDGFGDLLFAKCFSPRHFDGMNHRTGPFHVVFHSPAENTIDAHDDFVTGLDQVDDHGLHTGHPGPRHGKSQRVFGLKDFPQQLARFVHVLDVLRIEVSESRGRNRLEDPCRNGARSGPHQYAFARV